MQEIENKKTTPKTKKQSSSIPKPSPVTKKAVDKTRVLQSEKPTKRQVTPKKKPKLTPERDVSRKVGIEQRDMKGSPVHEDRQTTLPNVDSAESGTNVSGKRDTSV